MPGSRRVLIVFHLSAGLKRDIRFVAAMIFDGIRYAREFHA